MERIAYKDLLEIQNNSIPGGLYSLSIWINEKKWTSYVKAMKDLKLNFGGLVKHIIVDLDFLPARSNELSPIKSKDTDILPDNLVIKSGSHTVNFTAIQKHSIQEYMKRKDTTLKQLVERWLEINGY